jgi:hypothetical protein
MIFGMVALKRATRKTLLKCTAANFILAVLYPGLAYLFVHMPLVDLQKKLGGS